ncbi:MAG: hypothetical protein Q9208_004435 [Pyrenodesmia sp. 3 TL-2023]
MLDGSSPWHLHLAQNAALVLASILFLPLSTFILFSSYALNLVLDSDAPRKRKRIRSSPMFVPETILVTGVGMTKGLALARLFYEAGHDVIGVDFEPYGVPACGRYSRSLKKYYRLPKPDAENGAAPYIHTLLRVVKQEKVDLWVSCSGVASAVEDGQAKEVIERRSSCRAIQFDVATTSMLHEKNTFIEETQRLGLPVPETHHVTSRDAVHKVLHQTKRKSYIMKSVGVDDAVRGDMTLLPRRTVSQTYDHVSQIPISSEKPWVLQQYIKGKEYCTHSLVIEGEVKVFVACPSAELLMHYEALPSDSALSRAMLAFTREFVERSGKNMTGHLSFDFLVDENVTEKGAELVLNPIECNPRAHTAVALFAGQGREMAKAYLTLLKANMVNGNGHGPSVAEEPVVFPVKPAKYYWVGHDLVNLVLLPLLQLVLGQGQFSEWSQGCSEFLTHLLLWKDGTFETWDPLPWWCLYHIYWPVEIETRPAYSSLSAGQKRRVLFPCGRRLGARVKAMLPYEPGPSGSAGSQQQGLRHGPYPPNTAGLGGTPTVQTDVPVTAVFLFFFICCAVAHMAILQLNNKRGHKFLLSGMMFGFCMARITTCIMRIVWATRPRNIRIAIAAQIFVAAGVVLLFVINLIFAQRIIRAAHPRSGWHPFFTHFFTAIYVLIIVTLIMLITANVQSFYTLNSNTKRIDRAIILYGATFNAIASFLPFPLVIGGLVIPRTTRVEKFGTGRFRSKIAILLMSAFLLCLGATFRLGTSYKTPRPTNDPPAYYNKACFYIFNLTLELLVTILYVVVRVDRRFHVPNRSKGPGDYSGSNALEMKVMSVDNSSGRVLSEEEVFDDVVDDEPRSEIVGELGGVYQVAVPQFNRTKRFSNAYAHVAIDALLAIFWFAATISVATWTNAGIRNGVADLKGCDAFLYGDGDSRGSKCRLSQATIGMGVVIFLLFLATTFISVKNLLFYRRNGSLPGINTSPTGAHPLPHHHTTDDDDDQAKYAFSSNPNDHFDEDDDTPTGGPSITGRNTNYEVLHPAPDDHDTGLHPSTSSRPWNQTNASSTNLGRYDADDDTAYHGTSSSTVPPPQLPPHRDPFRDRSPSPYRVHNPPPPVEVEGGDTSYHGRYARPHSRQGEAGDPFRDELAGGREHGGRVDFPEGDYHR